MHPFTHCFIRYVINLSVPSLLPSLVDSICVFASSFHIHPFPRHRLFTRAFNQPFNQSVNQSINQRTNQSLTHSYIHSFVHAFVHFLILRSVTHSLTQSLVHPFEQRLVCNNSSSAVCFATEVALADAHKRLTSNCDTLACLPESGRLTICRGPCFVHTHQRFHA